MTAVVDIWNEALGLIGVAKEVNDPDTEVTNEASACRRFWPRVQLQVLRDFPWPRLAVVESLALVATLPNAWWGYSYRMPANVARFRRVLSECSPRLETQGTRIPFELGRDATGVLIFTDQASAFGEYTYQELDTAQYPADMIEPMVRLLASKIAARFGPEAVKLGNESLALYGQALSMARQAAMNEQRPDLNTVSDFERARCG
jgi:hypothetical protein